MNRWTSIVARRPVRAAVRAVRGVRRGRDRIAACHPRRACPTNQPNAGVALSIRQRRSRIDAAAHFASMIS